MKLSKKEGKEIGIILVCVLVVVIVGFGVNMMKTNELDAIKGAAVSLNKNLPTYPGILSYLRMYCQPVTGTGTCDKICGKSTCVPIDNDCSKTVTKNNCLCCAPVE